MAKILSANNEPQAPAINAIWREGLSGLEFSRLLAASPSLAVQPRGNREPVLVLPGYGTSNVSTTPLRSYLSYLGYSAHGWTVGRNRGNVAAMLPLVHEQVSALRKRYAQPVHLIGWSLGGVLAREVARDNPGSVRQVITMGSPIIGGPKYTSLARIYVRDAADLDEIERRIAEREQRPIRVPVTSIYSRRDGIVAWQASIDHTTPQADNVEVNTTHLGLGISPEVYKLLASKLSQV